MIIYLFEPYFAAVLLLIINIIKSKFKGEIAGADPWDARTLEWSIPSPVPEYHFLVEQKVEAVDHFWHTKYTEDEDGRLMLIEGVDIHKEPLRVTTEEAISKYGVHLPSPSFWPLLVGLSLPIIGYGLIFQNWFVCGFGALVLCASMLGWAIEPDTEQHAHHNDEEHVEENADAKTAEVK